MKKNILFLTLLVELLSYIPASGLSVVYNFRIAQITRKPIAEETNKRPNSASLLLFDFFQKTRCFDIRENYAGGLLTYNRNFAKKYAFRVDFSAAHVHQTVQKAPTTNITEPDDILFTIGRNLLVHEKSKVSFSVLLGIPTHSINTLQRVGFGTGQVGIGGQLDGLYKCTQKIDFLWGARCSYFIPRTAFDTLDTCHKFTIGSIADVLVALQTNNPLGHGFEAGYDARWGFGAHATPRIVQLDRLNYMRNNFYAVYKYTFLTERLAHRILLNISYGFDSKPKLYGFNAIMVWGSWGIAF
jgi:hypothetical protein